MNILFTVRDDNGSSVVSLTPLASVHDLYRAVAVKSPGPDFGLYYGMTYVDDTDTPLGLLFSGRVTLEKVKL